VPFGVGPPLADGLPRYLALSRIGEGTSGAVYSAEDRLFASEDRPARVAVKVLFEVDHGSASSIVAEAIRNRRVEHPNVVRALDAGTAPWGAAFIVSELINGGDLSAVHGPDRRLDLGEIVRIVTEAAKGVEAAHAAGVIHLDLKPSNVMVGNDGTVRVTDFGLARAIETEHGDGSASSFVGSLGFAPPEHLDGTATTASDVYGLGGLLYFLITGDAPNGATTDEARRWITGDPSGSNRHAASAELLRRAGAGRDLSVVCLKALSRLPADRHVTVAAFRADLDAIAALRPAPSIATGMGRRMLLRVRRRPWIAAGAAAICLALAGGIATSLRAAQIARVDQLQKERANRATSLREFAAKNKGTDVDSSGLQFLWALNAFQATTPIMDPEMWTVTLRGQRIDAARSIIARQVAAGRGEDIESALWRLALAFWVVNDKTRHGDEVEVSDAALAHLRRLKESEDRLITYAAVIRDSAVIKSSSFALQESGAGAEPLKVASDAAASLARFEMRLNEDEAGSPVHKLALHALSKAYEGRMLALPKEREAVVARMKELWPK
jgi:serine/threonine protein kinase